MENAQRDCLTKVINNDSLLTANLELISKASLKLDIGDNSLILLFEKED